MKSKDFSSHKHVALAKGVQGGRAPAGCPPGFQGRYTVQPGDTMFFIAQRYGVNLNSLIAANPHISDPNVIFPGDVLCVPGGPSSGGRIPASCPHGFQGRYTVQPGDTMFFIAQRYGVSLNSLIAANPHISDPNVIFPGDVLCVPGPPVPVPAPPAKGRVPKKCPHDFQGRYTVQAGDSMFTIAQKFGVSLSALIAANPHITNPNLIFPEDVLCVPEKLILPCCLIMKPKIHPVPGSEPGGVVLAQFLSTNKERICILAVGLPDPKDLDHYTGYQGIIQVPEQAEITFPLNRCQEQPPHPSYPEHPSHPGDYPPLREQEDQQPLPEQLGYPAQPDHPGPPPHPPKPHYQALWCGCKNISTMLTVDTKILVRAYKSGGWAGTTVLWVDLRGCRSGEIADYGYQPEYR